MKRFLSLLLVLLLTAGAVACAQPAANDGDGEKTGGKLIVYSALNEDNTIAMAEQFKEDTGIEIEYISLGGGDAVARVQAELSLIHI